MTPISRKRLHQHHKEISSHAFSLDEIYVIDLIRGGIKKGYCAVSSAARS